MMLEGKSGPYFSSLDSSIDILKKRAQDLIENINESRQKDHALMTNFRDSLKIKVSDLTEKLEERMYQIYNHHNKIIQEKLQEFTQKMAKISHLETELKQVCHTVETVYKDLCIQPEVRDINSCMGPPPEEGELWRLRRKQMSTQTKSVSTVPSPKPHRGHCHCKNPSDALAISLVAPGSPLRWCV
ncbi:synaptonemal complex central [Lynx pardinus]|uniref:Synaptonemal complex central n=1 Tax=Lynx pardinus TaxID=191816 RepID=A0A485P096_LYNPA|nr:synaptonemal complex central [Lynx pardinus]